MLITAMDQLDQLPEGTFRARIHYRSGHVSSRRVLREKDRFAVYARRSRTNGSWYHGFGGDIIAVEPVAQATLAPAEQWRRSWMKALAMLQESGLWPDLQVSIWTGLEVGYGKIRLAYDLYWQDSHKAGAILAVDDRLVRANENGELHVDTEIVWRMSDLARMKRMYFGRGQSEQYLALIAAAMRDGYPLNLRARAGYDVSFEYNPELNKAWYSEEYRGCGNGHYYLALSTTHALFYEDD